MRAMAAKTGKIEVYGVVRETLPNAMFRVNLEDAQGKPTGREILAHSSGKMRLRHIRVLPGDRVRIELSHYDLAKGRIVYREK